MGKNILVMILGLLLVAACPGAEPTPAPDLGAEDGAGIGGPIRFVLGMQGSRKGRITADRGGLSCPPACEADLAPGTVLRLTAEPEAGAYFAGWTGACTDTSPQCKVVITRAGPGRALARFSPSPPRSCTKDGWCREWPLSTIDSLRALHGFSSADVWGVGDRGRILHFTGPSFDATDLRTVPSGVPWQLWSVWGSGPADLWVAGERGVLRSNDGQSFRLESMGAGSRWTAVHGSGPEDVWVAGSQTLLHYTGMDRWQTYSIARGAISDVWAEGPQSAWAVGGNGLTLRWNGVRWEQVNPSGTTASFRRLFGRGGGQLYAASSAGVLRWQGTRWVKATEVPDLNLDSVYDVYVSDTGQISTAGGQPRRFNGTYWETFPSPGGTTAVWGSGADDVYWAGLGLVHWDGKQITRISAGPPEPAFIPGDLGTVRGRAPDDVWFAGGTEYSTLLHWIGDRFETVPLLDEARLDFDGLGWINAVRPIGPKDLWILPESTQAARWRGDLPDDPGACGIRVTCYPTLPDREQQDLLALSTGDVWIVGGGGLILRFKQDKWEPEVSRTTDSIRAVAGLAAEDLWAVGNRGMVLHRRMGTWVQVRSESNQELRAVIVSAPQDVWAVGWDSMSKKCLILRHQGTDERNWASVPCSSSKTLLSLGGTGPDDLWAGGEAGTLFRLTATGLQPVDSGAERDIQSVYASSRSETWAVTSDMVLHRGGVR